MKPIKKKLKFQADVKELQNKLIPLTKENLVKYGVLSQQMIDVLSDPDVEEIILLGAKGSGKTFPAAIWIVCMMVWYPFLNAFAFRKFKLSASEKLGSYISYAVGYLTMLGFDLGKRHFRQSGNKYLREKKKLTPAGAQTITFGSLDDPTATDGGAPQNAGYIGISLYEEIVDKEDMVHPEKIIKKHEFEATLGIIDDNLDRFNDAFADLKKLSNPPKYLKIKTFNPWGSGHPQMEIVEKIVSEQDYIRWIFGCDLEDILGNVELLDKLFKDNTWLNRILNNNTFIKKSEEFRITIVWKTKFSNPINQKPKNRNKIFLKIRKALYAGNKFELLRNIGLSYTPPVQLEDKAFNIQNYNERSREELEKMGWEFIKVSYGLDVDTSRVFTIVPSYRMRKKKRVVRNLEVVETYEEAVFIERPIDLKVQPIKGGNHTPYYKMLAKIISKHFHSKANVKVKKCVLVVDDNRGHYGYGTWNYLTFKSQWIKQKKHGVNEIEPRQDLIETSFDAKVLYLDKTAVELKNNYETCLRADSSSPKRKTSGSTNYLDRIDAVDGSIYPFKGVLLRGKRQRDRRKINESR